MPRERHISLGPLVAATGAALLVVSLFLDWYDDLTAFTVFEVLDLLLLALAIACLVALAERTGLVRGSGLSAGGRAALPLALGALVIVGSQVVNHPPAGVGRDPEIGLWLGLGGSGLLLAGTLLSVARISVALDVERRGAGSSASDGERPGEKEQGPRVPGAPSDEPPTTAAPAQRPTPERPA